jgi:glutaredoxin 2
MPRSLLYRLKRKFISVVDVAVQSKVCSFPFRLSKKGNIKLYGAAVLTLVLVGVERNVFPLMKGVD